MSLELRGLSWLRFECRCPIVLQERSPREVWCGRPDLLGITKARYGIEVEIKRSFQDFKADFDKPSRRSREFYLHHHARKFFYLVTPEIVEKVAPLVPEWAGLITTDLPWRHAWKIVKDAPINTASRRYTIKGCIRMVAMMSSQLHASELRAESWQARAQERTPWCDEELDYVI